mgnify:FL=1|jgi:hypothetical protein
MKRYHPILVVIHWVMLVLIVIAWTSGQFVLEYTPNSDPGKIDALRMRMTFGLIASPNSIPCGHWACECRTISSILAKGRAISTHVVWQTVLKLRWPPQNAGWPYI